MINPAQLKSITNLQDITLLTNIVNSLNDTFVKFNINTPLRECHFLAQILHESDNFKFVKEGLNYSADALANTFTNRYGLKDPKLSTPTQPVYVKNNLGRIVPNPLAVKLERKPVDIANNLYCDRMGNGNEASGDGAKFIGRGYIQITGRENYTTIGHDLNADFINHPELLETPQYAMLSAGWYWNKTNINILADKDDVLAVTKKINGGIKGLDDRTAKLILVKNILMPPKPIITGTTSTIISNNV